MKDYLLVIRTILGTAYFGFDYIKEAQDYLQQLQLLGRVEYHLFKSVDKEGFQKKIRDAG